MTIIQDKVVDKIRKLMELAGSSNEHEAEVAAKRAAELMAKHQISEAEIAMAADAGAKVHVERGRIDVEDPNGDASRVEAWHKFLSYGIAEVFGCKMWMHGRGRDQQFFALGTPDAVATTRYMYMTLAKQISRLSRVAMKERGETQNAWRRAYSEGMVRRVVERLKEGKKAGFSEVTTTAMVWIDKTKQAVVEAYAEISGGFKAGKTKGAQRRVDGHYVGYRDGSKVDIGGATNALGEGQKKLK